MALSRDLLDRDRSQVRMPALIGLAAVLLVSCSDEPARLCTLIGGGDALHVLLPDGQLQSLSGPLEAEVCAAALCGPRTSITGNGQAILNDGSDFMRSEPTTFRLRLYASGLIVKEASGEFTPLTYAPNGPDCGGRYSLMTLTLADEASRLAQVPPGDLGLNPRLVP